MMRLTGKLPEASKQPNYDAISLTLQCWLYQILTDAFGDIPMSEACSADEGILAPKFDTQQQVYQQIIYNLKTSWTPNIRYRFSPRFGERSPCSS